MLSLIELKNGHIASGHWNGQIKIWDQRTRECIGEWEGHTGDVNRLIEINNNNIGCCSYNDKLSKTFLIISDCLINKFIFSSG